MTRSEQVLEEYGDARSAGNEYDNREKIAETRKAALARFKELEGHRDMWRRAAWRLFGELERLDPKLAKEILEGTAVLEKGGV